MYLLFITIDYAEVDYMRLHHFPNPVAEPWQPQHSPDIRRDQHWVGCVLRARSGALLLVSQDFTQPDMKARTDHSSSVSPVQVFRTPYSVLRTEIADVVSIAVSLPSTNYLRISHDWMQT